ncbi:uncharacterized protein LOC107713070 [Sinocyclocheilus rhinocerous]|uniref:uncharacterized protein LOC107713070 n=1 Tax=Sinocyclocheilus rhinocerous TaxID=307959 RepID=UPI0007B990C8|nr:PREDICTED: uncharacterized protein LOC107713070 [Sinocyclocheilus rhinocerous]
MTVRICEAHESVLVEALLSLAPPPFRSAPSSQLAGFALFYLSIMSLLCALYCHLEDFLAAAEPAVSPPAHPGRARFASGGRDSSCTPGSGSSETHAVPEHDPDRPQRRLPPRSVAISSQQAQRSLRLLSVLECLMNGSVTNRVCIPEHYEDYEVALFLFLTGLLGRAQGWQNNYDGPLNFNCPAGQSISSITSENSNHHEDRRWEFGCQATFGQSAECYWTNYVNDFDQALLFECPAEHVMTGTSSYHNDYFEDRRWRFYCCRSPCVTKDCHWTSYVNSFDEYFTWTVPSRNILVGAQSYHQNHEE